AFAYRASIRANFIIHGYPMHGTLAQAEEDVTTALHLDPRLGWAHGALALLRALQREWVAAEESYQTAQRCDPMNPSVWGAHAVLVAQQTGQLKRSVQLARRARRLAPADPWFAMVTALAHCLIGEDSEALQCANQALDLGFVETASPLPQVYAWE